MTNFLPAFPMERFHEIKNRPKDFRLLERIPSLRYPYQLVAQRPTDEQAIVFLDIETTGFLISNESIIELGLLKVKYSPSMQNFTFIEGGFSSYEDPEKPIPEKVIQLTKITNNVVQGKKIDDKELTKWLLDDPLIIAHNAEFDRSFFEKRFPQQSHYKWACSCNDVNWQSFGFESNKLEYLLMRLGWFYEGHQAEIDCKAILWLFYIFKKAFVNLWEKSLKNTVLIKALEAPFEVKDQLKERGYRWNSLKKYWWHEIDEGRLSEEQNFLNNLYRQGAKCATYEHKDARSRFK